MDVVYKRVSGLSDSEGDAELSIQKSTAGSVRVLSGEEVPFHGAADERNIQMQGETLRILNPEMQLESLLPSPGLSIYGKEASVSSLRSSGLGRPGAPTVTQVLISGREEPKSPLSPTMEWMLYSNVSLDYLRVKGMQNCLYRRVPWLLCEYCLEVCSHLIFIILPVLLEKRFHSMAPLMRRIFRCREKP